MEFNFTPGAAKHLSERATLLSTNEDLSHRDFMAYGQLAARDLSKPVEIDEGSHELAIIERELYLRVNSGEHSEEKHADLVAFFGVRYPEPATDLTQP